MHVNEVWRWRIVSDTNVRNMSGRPLRERAYDNVATGSHTHTQQHGGLHADDCSHRFIDRCPLSPRAREAQPASAARRNDQHLRARATRSLRRAFRHVGEPDLHGRGPERSSRAGTTWTTKRRMSTSERNGRDRRRRDHQHGQVRGAAEDPGRRPALAIDKFNEFNPCQNGGIVGYLHEHGTDSGCGDNNWPKTFVYLAGWGFGHATLNGKPLYDDYEMHFMVTQGIRDRKTLRVNYPMANKKQPAAK